MTTVQPRREEAIKVGFEACLPRLNGLSFKDWEQALRPWEVKAFVKDEEVIGMLMTKGNELHVAVKPEVRGKWLSRRLIREVFEPVLEFGEWKTSVSPENKKGEDFVKRVRKGLESGRFDPISATIGAGAILGGGAAIYGAQQQRGAADTASSIQQSEFQQNQANLQPWMQQGQMSLAQMGQGLQPGGQFNHMFNMQDFQQSPAYQFNLQQGQMAVDKAANAKGGGNLYAPQTLQDISRFSQGLASNEFQNAFSNYQTGVGNIWNRLYNTSQSGQNAAAGIGGFGTTTAGQIGQNTIGAGQASAAGTMGAAGAIGGGLNAFANNMTLQQILAQQQQGSLVQEQVPGQFSTGNPAFG